MDTKDFIKGARENFTTALGVCQIIILGGLQPSISEILQVFAILRNWIDEYGKAVLFCHVPELLAAKLKLRQLMQLCEQDYINKVLKPKHSEILNALCQMKVEDMTADEKEAVREFVKAEEEYNFLAISNWKEFVPKM